MPLGMRRSVIRYPLLYHERRRNALITSWDEEECNMIATVLYHETRRNASILTITSWDEEECKISARS